MKIREICSRVVVVVEPHTDLREAARLMRDHHVGALVVPMEPPMKPYSKAAATTGMPLT